MIEGILRRALESWRIVVEVHVTDEQGIIRASSNPDHVGQKAPSLTNFEEWKSRSLLGNVWRDAAISTGLPSSR